MNKTKVGITGTGSVVGQAIIKSALNSRLAGNIELVGFDYFNETVGSYWVAKQFILPDFLKKEVKAEAWLEKIIEHIGSEEIKLLFVGIDFELKLFARYREVIESQTQCKVLVSGPNVIKTADDKYLTYKFLKENNLYYLDTFLPNELSGDGINFPCVLKPRCGWGGRGVFVVRDMAELREKLSEIDEPIIQTLAGITEDEYTCGVIYVDGKVEEAIALRRDLKNGDTIAASFSENTPRIIYDYVYEISSKLKPFGVCNYQLRLDKEGIPRVFEINARHSGTTYIRSLFGFNEVEYLMAYFLGFEVKKFKLREGIVKRYYDEMFIGA